MSTIKRAFHILGWFFGKHALRVSAMIDEELPITITQPLSIPIQQRIMINLEDFVDIEASIPVVANLRIDTTVETEVLKFGRIRIPIRANIPISMNVPIAARVRARLNQVPIEIKEEITVPLPPLSVPVSAIIKTRVSLNS